jgi:hypothetical protein
MLAIGSRLLYLYAPDTNMDNRILLSVPPSEYYFVAHGSSCVGMFPCSMPSVCLGLDFSFLMRLISLSIPLVLLSIVSLGLVMARLLGPLLLICGAGGGSSPKRVMWMEWDGGEVPVGCEAIRDKDTE